MSARVRSRRGASILVRGLVQGVGFRPAVWRLAREHEIVGSVWNDGSGVRIEAWGSDESIDRFVDGLRSSPPPLARVDGVELGELRAAPSGEDFVIAASRRTRNATGVLPDAATCVLCAAEIRDVLDRRFRHPFTNCTHCGPRFSIALAVPYDRRNTTMRDFRMCAQCRREYEDPADRRFHAQPNACPACGPRVLLERADGRALAPEGPTVHDQVDAVAALLRQGEILAIKGIGGYHLACDATQPEVVARLRERKRRPHKPLALMARDVELVRRYAEVSPREGELLSGPAAPIVLLRARAPRGPTAAIAPGVAGGLPLLGFMLPHTPLHHLMLMRMDRPVVMTSGNLSEAPPCTDDDDARASLGPIATHFLTPDRPIHNRVDDSVVRVMAGEPRVLRRSRGYAPAPLPVPPGFEDTARVLAFGGELKNTFCMLGEGRAVVSQHIGDLGDARVHDDYRAQLDLLARLFGHRPELLAVDAHPDYVSTSLGRERAESAGLELETVQHHHAHVASCLFEHGIPLEHPPVLGVALDGIGYGLDGTFWGGELLLADYAGFERRGTFKPVALLGGEQAMRQPWRNTLAHLLAGMGRSAFELHYGDLELAAYLRAKPLETLERVASKSPVASSCGRLFDAVAAAVGICRGAVSYEGQAAVQLEAAADPQVLGDGGPESAYPFAVAMLGGDGLPYVEPLSMWRALLGDLAQATPVPVMAARFHNGLARVVARMVLQLTGGGSVTDTVALTGGVFQNRTLLELVVRDLEQAGLRVLHHRAVPCNDGGLSLGQAAVAAARRLKRKGGSTPCA